MTNEGREPYTHPSPLQDAYLSPNRQCTATSKRTGNRCNNRAMIGQRTCRMHGGSTKRARTAANKRIAQASGYAADMLVEFMADPAVAIDLRTKIAQDLLNRAGVSASQLLQVEVGAKFQDVLEGVLIDVDVDANVVDAEVVADAEDAEERRDAEQEQGAFRQRMGLPASRSPQSERPMFRDDREREMFEAMGRGVAQDRAADVGRAREAYLEAIDAGASSHEAQTAAERAARAPSEPGERRPRTSEAKYR